MYNRYVPQPDGSHRRSTVNSGPERARPVPPPKPEPVPICSNPPSSHDDHFSPPPVFKAGDFLRRLIPKDLDTGDLLIIVLLLLMSADCQEEKNSALLTLALYLFM